MTADGTVIASMPPAVAHDAAGNPNDASTSTDNSVTYDITPPTVTINQAAAQADPTNAAAINFTVVFSEPVTGFAGERRDAQRHRRRHHRRRDPRGSDGTTYNVAVSGMTQDGTVIASIAAGMAHDAAGNRQRGLDQHRQQRDLRHHAADGDDQSGGRSGRSDQARTINFTVVFSEPVTDLPPAT